MRNGRASQEERRVDIGPERAVPFLGADIADIRIGPLESGIVHEDIELAEVFQALPHKMAAVIIARNIAWKDDGLASRLINPARGLIGALVFTQIGNRDIGAFARESDGDRPADAGIGTGDQCHLPL